MNMNDLNNTEQTLSEEEEQSYADNLLDAIQSGATIKDIHGVSDETLNGIYQVAYDFYCQGKLQDAESLFRFLCIYDFYNPEYAMGLAAVHQLKKDYAKAIDFYALAYSHSREDYRPMLYAGQCNIMLKRGSQAKQCFEIVIAKCTDPTVCDIARAYLNAITETITAQAKSPKEET